MNKKIIIPAIALTILAGLTINGVTRAYADESSNNFPPMVQGLVEKFNLNKDEVSSYLEEQRQVRQEERRTEREGMLNTAVSEGKITEEQKTLLLNKMDEYRNNKEDFFGLTREEKQQAIEEHRAEMQTWAEENGIDLPTLNLGRGGFGGGLGKDGLGSKGMSPREGGLRGENCINNAQ